MGSVLFLEEPGCNHYVSVPATQGAGGATTGIPRKVKRPAQCWCQIQREASRPPMLAPIHFSRDAFVW